jgi:two-component system sensor histidine kinase UhpB
LSQQLLTLQEEERGEIARELHDEMGPFLFAVNIDTMQISRRLHNGPIDKIASHVQSISDAVAHMQRQVRSMLQRLRPVGLSEYGLCEAIANLVDSWRRRCPEIDYRLEIAPDCMGFGEFVDATIYRVVQECLINATRHGKPSTIAVTVRCDSKTKSGPQAIEAQAPIVVRVVDDGRGMSAPSPVGYGLLGMGERIKAIGGLLTISNDNGAGVTVSAILPNPGRNLIADASQVAS